jgi:hypothetical protein
MMSVRAAVASLAPTCWFKAAMDEEYNCCSQSHRQDQPPPLTWRVGGGGPFYCSITIKKVSDFSRPQPGSH